MSNTKSPKTASYRICRTINKEHLNGVITLIDFGNKKGIALVYVSESRPGFENPVWHVSSEFIEYDETNKVWKTRFPHSRYNGDQQDWCFEKITCREEGKPSNISNNGGDNGKNYQNYINYYLESHKKSIKVMLQGNGTGTGGNGETGNK